MNHRRVSFFLGVLLVLGRGISLGQEEEVTSDSLLPIHLEAAREYEVSLEGKPDAKVRLREQPVTQWTNMRRSGGQIGHVFLWMDQESPVAIGGIFSFPWRGVISDRRVVHELHALSPTKLNVSRNGKTARWQPKSGLKRIAIPNMNSPTITTRFPIQARQLARRFSGHCLDTQGVKWQLRMLPRPCLIYPIQHGEEEGMGAVFGMMGDVGSDLESGVIIEAIGIGADQPSKWQFAPIRLTDMETYLRFDDQTIWKSVRTSTDTAFFDTPNTYFRFQDKTVSIDTQDR